MFYHLLCNLICTVRLCGILSCLLLSGSIPWFYTSELFEPNSAQWAVSISIAVNWLCNFAVGVSFIHLQVSGINQSYISKPAYYTHYLLYTLLTIHYLLYTTYYTLLTVHTTHYTQYLLYTLHTMHTTYYTLLTIYTTYYTHYILYTLLTIHTTYYTVYLLF